VEDLAEAASSKSDSRYIYRDGRLLAMPTSAWRFLRSPLLSLRAKLRLMLEPFIPGGADEADTAQTFFTRRFGREATTFLMGPFVSGIYAGDPAMLGARSAFAKFWNWERDRGSMILGALAFMREKKRRLQAQGVSLPKGLFSMRGGLGTLTSTLAQKLGDSLVTGSPVSRVSRQGGSWLVEAGTARWQAGSVVVAAPPPQARMMLSDEAPVMAPILGAIPLAPVAMVHWSQPDDNRLPQGFGFLMPRIYDLRVLGTVFASQLFEGRAPEGQQLLSSFYGGMMDKGALGLDDEALAATLLAEHGRIFGTPLPRPSLCTVLRYPAAIPQLLPDHPDKVAALEAELSRHPGLVLAGNYLSGVGIEHAVTSGYEARGRVLSLLSGDQGPRP